MPTPTLCAQGLIFLETSVHLFFFFGCLKSGDSSRKKVFKYVYVHVVHYVCICTDVCMYLHVHIHVEARGWHQLSSLITCHLGF